MSIKAAKIVKILNILIAIYYRLLISLLFPLPQLLLIGKSIWGKQTQAFSWDWMVFNRIDKDARLGNQMERFKEENAVNAYCSHLYSVNYIDSTFVWHPPPDMVLSHSEFQRHFD